MKKHNVLPREDGGQLMKCKFTLIELLVCVSIIMILVAMLLPVLTNVKRKARMVACSSNLKQTTLAIFMYADDSNNRFADVWREDLNGFNTAYGYSDTYMNKYFPNLNLVTMMKDHVDFSTWKCAEFSGIPDIDNFTQNDINYGKDLRSTVSYYPGNTINAPYTTDTKVIKNDSNKAIVSDHFYTHNGAWRSNHGNGKYWNNYDFNKSLAFYAGGILGPFNCAFADGRVEQLKLENLVLTYSQGAVDIYAVKP